MRLITYRTNAFPRLGVWLGTYVLDVQLACGYFPCELHAKEQLMAGSTSMLALLQTPDEVWTTLRDGLAYVSRDMEQQADTLLEQEILFRTGDVTLLAPIPAPGKVICVAGNYPAPGVTQKPEHPIIFLKPSSSITGADMPIWISHLTKNVAYEVELALVIGKRARHVTSQEALQYIAGYTLANDVGDRVLEKRTSQWTSGKMFDSFTPMGPWLVTKDEIPVPGALEMSTLVNGQVVQAGNTAEMFFDIAELVSILSDLTTLLPGDVILTGSPKMMDGKSNPALVLTPGDSVTIKIDGLGELTNPVHEELL